MKVLFLTPWYPSEKDAMSGLFVQKHVEAVRAEGVEVQVIFSQSWADTFRQWRALRRLGWIPDIVQLNVIQKQGALALWLKKRYGIPFVVIEHWSGYLPENGSFAAMPEYKKRFFCLIAREAACVMPVCQTLRSAMQSYGIEAQKWDQIDNVVDDFFFSHETDAPISRNSVKTILNVTCFDERAKNVKGLLRAAKMMSLKRQDWQLVLVGTGVDYREVRHFADELEIPNGLLRWTGELRPEEVAEEMRRADLFVLSSRYETYGVVLAEACAARLPILSTPVGIAPEIGSSIVPQEVAQYKSGRFAEYIENKLFSERPRLSGLGTERFSAQAIGQKLISIYDSCLHRDI